MSVTKNLLAGLGGAIALNILHESLKHKKGSPRIDLLCEEALQKALEPLGEKIKDKDNLYIATLAGDVLSNAMYYSTIGAGSNKNIWPRAIAIGLLAGVGAVKLPDQLGLDDGPVASTQGKQLLTTAYYLFGALVTAGLVQAMKSKK